MKMRIIGLSAWLAIGLIAGGYYVSPSADQVPTAERERTDLPERQPSLLYSGGPCTTTTTNGPVSQGTTGSVRCVFTSGSPTPATKWWLDTPTKPNIPSLVHNVVTTGGTVIGISQGAHTVYFEVAAGNTPPPHKAISVANDKTVNVYVTYN